MTKGQIEILIKEKEKIEKKIKNDPFIDPKNYRRINEIISLLMTDGESKEIKFNISKPKKSNRVTSFTKDRR